MPGMTTSDDDSGAFRPSRDVRLQVLQPGECVPHGTHPSGERIVAYRDAHGLLQTADSTQPSDPHHQPLPDQGPQPALLLLQPQPAPMVAAPKINAMDSEGGSAKAGVWLAMPTAEAIVAHGHIHSDRPELLEEMAALQAGLKGLPHEYIQSVVCLERPQELLCGHRKAKGDREAELLKNAVEAMFVDFVELVLVIQLFYLDLQNDYKLLTRDSIHRHAACAMLQKRPTDMLTAADFVLFNSMYKTKVAPFEAALRVYDRPSLLQFFERELGTLYIYGIPVMSTRVSRFEPGWRQANQYLEIAGSRLRLRLCVLGSSTELLLAEPIQTMCTPEVIMVGRERARTAMLAFEVASTQDTAENPVKMFRKESTDFIAHHKWNLERIQAREWNSRTYGPTQKLVIRAAFASLNNDRALVKALLDAHCTNSLIEYQSGEQMVNSHTFSSVQRGILHALFSKHVPLEDMHSWLVDTVDRPTRHGILQCILQSRHQNEARTHIRLLMYTTDTWFSADRLYTVLMVGTMAASVMDQKMQYGLLEKLLPQLYRLTAKALATMACKAQKRFHTALYKVLNHTLTFETISRILKQQYRRNDGFLDEASLRFNSSFWMNILGYYVRLTNCAEAFDLEVMELADAFVSDVLELLQGANSQFSAMFAYEMQTRFGHIPVVRDMNVPPIQYFKQRLNRLFQVLSTLWDRYVKSEFGSLPPAPLDVVKRKRPIVPDNTSQDLTPLDEGVFALKRARLT